MSCTGPTAGRQSRRSPGRPLPFYLGLQLSARAGEPSGLHCPGRPGLTRGIPAGAPSALAHTGPTGGGHSQAAGQGQGRGADPEIKLMAPGLCPLLPEKEPFSWRCSEFQGKPLKQLFDASPVGLHLFSVLLGINLQFSASPSLPLSPKRREGEKKKGSALSP